MHVLALIPARGGSKSVPRKNLVSLAGFPLIAFSIASGRAATLVDRVIVSTDDPEIAEVSRIHGAEVPFLRPASLAQDNTPDFPVFEHALRWLEREEGFAPDVVVQLRPTSPLRPRGLIDRAIRSFCARPEADCARGVVASEENPFKTWLIDEDGWMQPLLQGRYEEPYNMPRQLLPATYWQTGHIDVISTRTVLEKRSLTGSRILPVFIERAYCVDIDGSEHIKDAERILKTAALDLDWPKMVGSNENPNHQMGEPNH